MQTLLPVQLHSLAGHFITHGRATVRVRYVYGVGFVKLWLVLLCCGRDCAGFACGLAAAGACGGVAQGSNAVGCASTHKQQKDSVMVRTWCNPLVALRAC